MAKGVRIDKWLWAARFFKTRSLAAKACELGRVESGGQTAKPSREVQIGDRLHIRNAQGEFVVEVRVPSEIRGGAAVAATYYEETPESRQRREQLLAERKAMPHFEAERAGKPSKRDRRELNKLRERW